LKVYGRVSKITFLFRENTDTKFDEKENSKSLNLALENKIRKFEFVLHLCRWFRFAQLAKGKKFRP
jgi:hypothetical protein